MSCNNLIRLCSPKARKRPEWSERSSLQGWLSTLTLDTQSTSYSGIKNVQKNKCQLKEEVIQPETGNIAGPCPLTGFTGREKQLLQDSWTFLKGDTEYEFKTNGLKLLIWMFENVPDMRSRFSFKIHTLLSYGELVDNEAMLAHSLVVALSIDKFIRQLNRPDKLAESLRGFARTHVRLNPSVGEVYFQNLENLFGGFIVKELNVDGSDEVVGLWVRFIGLLRKAVSEEMVRAPKKDQKCCHIL